MTELLIIIVCLFVAWKGFKWVEQFDPFEDEINDSPDQE